MGWLSRAWESGKKAIGRAGTAVWHGVTHGAGEVGKWAGQHWREIVIVAVVIAVTVFTAGLAAGPAILIGAEVGAAAGAAGGFAAAALYGGNIGEDIDAAVKGGVIGFFSGMAFAGVGSQFTPAAGQELTTTSQIESVAAHGVVGGAKSLAEGEKFWNGFIAAAATKTTSFGGSFGNYAADTTRAAVVGGTVAVLTHGKFENGAVTGAFSYAFDDYLQRQSPNEELPEEPKGSVIVAMRSSEDGFGGPENIDAAEIFSGGPQNALAAPALKNQLAEASAFTADGGLSEEAMAYAKEIVPSWDIGNLKIPNGLVNLQLRSTQVLLEIMRFIST
jgi:hypothetical protein